MSAKFSNGAVSRPELEAAPKRVSLFSGPIEGPFLKSPATPSNRIWGGVRTIFGWGDDVISLTGSQTDRLQLPEAARASRDSNTFVTLDELERLRQERPVDYVVDGLLPGADVHVAVGDSGLGKTPWAYQLGLCVATGRPFLNHAVKQVRVLYFDLENGREQILDLAHSVRRYLEIGEMPSEFLVIKENSNPPSLAKAIEEYKPGLVIIDTLRAFRSDVEEGNEKMGRFLQETRSLARSTNCAILLLHHVRKNGPAKPGDNGVPALEETPTLEWLREAAGARALINQTTTRIAFDTPRGNNAKDAAFVMKYFVKIKGESAPIYLERVCNDDGDPVGYRSIVGVQLLGDVHQQAAFNDLPPRFSFKEAKRIYGRTDDPTRNWLLKCIAANLVRQIDRGVYERLDGKKG